MLPKQAGLVYVLAQRRPHSLPTGAGAHGQLLGRLPGQHRVDIDGLELRFDRLKATEPVAVVFGLQSERYVNPEPERPLVGEWNADVKVRDQGALARFTPCSAERLKCGGLRSVVVKLGRK